LLARAARSQLFLAFLATIAAIPSNDTADPSNDTAERGGGGFRMVE
jgi:hypothetical protein